MAGKWIGQLRALVGAWEKAWQGNETEPPQLVLRGDANEPFVFDSRSGVGVEHRLSAGGRWVLELISGRAKRVSEVVKEVTAEEGLDVQREMADLREKGLVFEEGDRFLSLVFMDSYSDKQGRDKHESN
jgi:magnesium-protoporphyrin IX monomethyl ester (oxidative) cyclase